MSSADMRLQAVGVDLGYGGAPVVADLNLAIPDGRITAICGPNACGKSTLLRALARLLAPTSGAVLLDGQAISTLPSRAVATRLGLLPQTPVTPDGLVVEDLVARGRFPHQRWFAQFSDADHAAVERALALTGTEQLRHRPVDELSGGQRQRAWIAMALAQDTSLLLLDEPTMHLDLAHRIEVLDLLAELNETEGRTVAMVLHELNEVSRYAHHVVAMRDGRVVAEGPPRDIISVELVRAVFGLDAVVITDPVTGTPLCVPLGRRSPRALSHVPTLTTSKERIP